MSLIHVRQPDHGRAQGPVRSLTKLCPKTVCQALLIATCPFHFLPLVPGFLGEKTITLEDEEAVYEVKCGICNVNTRRPYGELQSVDKTNCLCCVGIASGLIQTGPVCPGMGCNSAFVDEIVKEMKKRMKERGDTGQIRRTEEALDELKALRGEIGDIKSDLSAIMKALNVAPMSMATYGSAMDRS